MSMLAEKKRRTKWAPNPQGNLWSNDKNKYGQKLLEKMGWSPGQGLGVQNQGRSDVLRLQFKNDNKGFGFKGNDDHWLKQQQEFNDILSKLAEKNQTDEDITPVKVESKPVSLELKSSQSRCRIHYHKFTRGKDLSQYSEKDLAAILGITVSKTANSDGVDNKNHINAGSMEDYFKAKQLESKPYAQDGMAKGIRSIEEDRNGFHGDTRDHHSVGSENVNNEKMSRTIPDRYESKKKRFFLNEGLEGETNAKGEDLSVDNKEKNENVLKKKKKEKNKHRKGTEENNQDDSDIHNIINVNDCVEVNKKISKKKSKSANVAHKIIVEANHENLKGKIQKMKVDDVKGSGNTTLKRKSRSGDTAEHQDNDFEENVKPAKKKRKLKDGRLGNFVEDCQKANDEVESSLETNNVTSKKKKLIMLEVESVVSGENVIIENENCKQSKKVKKNKTLTNDDICRTDIVDEKKEQKKKTKESPKESSLGNNIANQESNEIESEEKRQMKKTKRRSKESSLVNDIANGENNDIESEKKCQKKETKSSLMEIGLGNDIANEENNDIKSEEKKLKKKKKQKRQFEENNLKCDAEIHNLETTETLTDINNVEKVESKKSKKLFKKSKTKVEVEVQEDAACNNDEVKTKQIEEGYKTIGKFREKVDDILGAYKKAKETKSSTETSKSTEGGISNDFVSLNYQSNTNFSSDNFQSQTNVDSNETDYKSYYSKPINQYSYNSLRGNGQSTYCWYNNNYRGGGNFNNRGVSHFQNVRGNASRGSRGFKQPSDMKVVRQYFTKYKLVITEPELDFKGANISKIGGYGKLKEII